jgi:hypothetical protein
LHIRRQATKLVSSAKQKGKAMDAKTAKIARETCVDVATPEGSVGCIDFLSTRNGVKGAELSYGNPLCWEDQKWWPLTDLELCGQTAREVVAKYL